MRIVRTSWCPNAVCRTLTKLIPGLVDSLILGRTQGRSGSLGGSDETISLDREAGPKQIAGINEFSIKGVQLIKRGDVRAMPRSDQETVLHALEHARRIVGHCIAGQRDATRTVEHLLTVLDEVEIVDALDRMSRRRILRL
jgi:hypothetical protein